MVLSRHGSVRKLSGAGKRDMQKKTDTPGKTHIAQHKCHMHKMVVVNPDIIVLTTHPPYSLTKFEIHIQIAVPITWLEITAGLKIMKQRPYDLVGKTVIKPTDLFLCHKNRVKPIPGSLGVASKKLIKVNIILCTRPTNPQSTPIFENRGQAP